MNTDFKEAAIELKNYYQQNKEKYDSQIEDTENSFKKFKELYSPEVIKDLDDSEVLNFIFGDIEDNSLFHNLEFGEFGKFGGIKGGFSSKRYLYKDKDTKNWKFLNGKNVSNEEATEKALEFRKKLLNACDYISSIKLETLEDYIDLDSKLYNILENLTKYIVIRKYFYLLYPNYFFPFYQEDLIKYFLCRMNILPRYNYYDLLGQLSILQKESNIPSYIFSNILGEKYGFISNNFIQFNISNQLEEFLKTNQSNHFFALNLKSKENLNNLTDSELTIKNLQNRFGTQEFPNENEEAKNLAREIKKFIKPDKNPVFVIKNNNRIIGLLKDIGEYEYSPDNIFPHQRKGTWIFNFSDNETLPKKENTLNIYDSSNLLYLYNHYYNSFNLESLESKKSDLFDLEDEPNNRVNSIRYQTNFSSSFSRNILLFGAPGTGKSYRLNEQRKELLGDLSETNYERVTFYPDYSYANFVGTYKPATDKETKNITYKFIPGPFARIYSKAIKNTKTENIEPFLLIIEELNRANAAAVFGDLFQLLDRINNVSEYPITTSEEFRSYLAEEVGGEESDFESIRLPDNLFIWATMNNADQGVYPIDTAFKRRWGYKPLNINENDQLIKDKYVFLGKNKDQKVEWNKLRKAINEFLSKQRVNEDKQLGPFFLNLNDLPITENQIDSDSFSEAFKNKILIYLFEDAARRIRQKIFSGCQKNYRYSDLCEEFDKNGIQIFDQEIVNLSEPEIVSSEILE